MKQSILEIYKQYRKTTGKNPKIWSHLFGNNRKKASFFSPNAALSNMLLFSA
jgi:hypothetical protein